MTRPVIPLFCFAAAAVCPAIALEPRFEQLTETPFGYGMFEPSISAAGSRIAFSASYDFSGQNPEQNFEVYVYDSASATFSQLTDTPFGFGHFTPLITPDGAAIVFRTPYDHTGGNADGSFELFEVDVATGIIRQLTNNPASTGLFTPKLSGDGRYVTYRSNGNPLGINPERNFEIFRSSRITGDVTQVTDTPSGTLNELPDIDGDGDRIVFESRYDFDGSNPNGNVEIWVWDAALGISAVTATPIAQTSDSPAIDDEGRFVAFLSRYDFSGGNPGNTQEIYVADTFSGTFAQVTTPGPLLHLEPVMAPGGSYLIFESQRDPLGLNPDQNREIFHYDIAAGVLTQLTETTGGISISGMSDRAQTYYAAIAGNAAAFAIRNEHDLEPGFPNIDSNLELFRGSLLQPGDMNCDGFIDNEDIDPFVLAVTQGQAAYQAVWPACEFFNADVNGDGFVDNEDIDPFVALLTG